MKEGNENFEANRFQDAISVYNNILAKNPYHTDALLNISSCYASIGMFEKALDAVYKSVDVDKNIRNNYFQLSQIYLSHQYPEFAIGALEQELMRWKYDSEALLKAIDISIDYDFIEHGLKKIEFLANELGSSFEAYISSNQQLKKRVADSQARANKYHKLTNEASRLQQNKSFDKATPLLNLAISTSKIT